MAAIRRGQPELRVRLPSGSQQGASSSSTTTPVTAALPSSLASSSSPSSDQPLPPISALFLIEFDVKAGYTISWKEAVRKQPELELEGVVEYKSLPSGLHTVSDDLIYLVHEGGYAGLSAFVNAPVDDSATRNARMLAVGVLVPLSYGRLGRAWKHAEGLKELAARLAANAKDIDILRLYWEKHHARENDAAAQPERPLPKPITETPVVSFQAPPRTPQRGHARNRSMSDGAALVAPGHRLSPYHPAWSLTRLLDTFGPLIFPIQRAALLRKRILISCHAPVHEICNFVYNISILSNIPLSTFELLSSPNFPPHRLRPLFTVGVHDIPFLMSGAKFSSDHESGAGSEAVGWIACTTDSILATKDTLCDMLITMPPAYADRARDRVWPTVECPHGTPVKATQRDLRRYRSLRAGLARLRPQQPSASAPASAGSPSRPSTAQQGKKHNTPEDEGEESSSTLLTEDDERTIVEPLSWAALAYSGFMWWASAGEQSRSDEAEEAAHDASLLAGLPSASRRPGSPAAAMSMGGARPLPADLTTSLGSLAVGRAAAAGGEGAEEDADDDDDDDEARTELATIAYFHRLTTQILTTLADVVVEGGGDSASESDEDPEPDPGDDPGDNGYEDAEENEALLSRRRGAGDDDEVDSARRGRAAGRGVPVSSQAMAAMGLDVWSAADAAFVVEAVERYFGRRAYVEGKGVEVCGVRVC